MDLSSLRSDFINYLETHPFEGHPISLYEPINYIMGLGGKRMRPLLLLMSYQLYDGAYEKAMDAALAIELFHNFTLAHDDIMDEASLRRGKPTMHEAYNQNTAILAGDLMLIKSYELLAKEVGKSQFITLLEVFNRAAIQICEGQQMDMDFEKRQDVKIAEYLKMIEYKTAVLLGAAMEIGARMGGASDQDAKAIYAFAVDLGIAFQINDDILDAYGDPEKFGKKACGDIARNKKTFLWLYCQSALSEEDNKEFRRLALLGERDEADKIAGMLALYDTYRVKEEAERLSQDFYLKALQHLNVLEIADEKQAMLRTFAQKLMEREM